MVHIDTSDPIRNRADLVYHATQQYGAYGHETVLTSSVMQPNNMVYIDMFDPTCNRVDLVCHATKQHCGYIHIRPTTQLCWPRLSCHLISSNPTLWCCNQSIQFAYDLVPRCYIIIQALIDNVKYVCLCKCTNMYINHQIVNYQFSSSIHYHIRIISQQLIHTSNCHDAVISCCGDK